MRITDIRSMRLMGPMLHAVGGEQRTITKIIVRVDTDTGLYGLGEADDFMGVRESIEHIKTCLVGRDPLAIRPFVSEMLYGAFPTGADSRYHTASFQPSSTMSPTATPTGAIAWGMSGVEIALCDLAGKALNTPVYNLFGGKYRDRVRIYLDRSSPKDVDNLDAWKRMASDVVEGGFTQMKFDIEQVARDFTEDTWNRSIPARQMRKIVERLTVVRETAGWDVEVCVDCHMHYNATDAIRLANELAPLKMMWLEDPTPITNPDSCASVREKSPIPICVGEMFIAEQFRLFIDRKACDIIHPDVIFAGGLHETCKIADYADLHHLPMAMHSNGGSLATIAAAHVAAASRNFLGLEYHFIETDWVGEYVLRKGAPLFQDGFLPLTDAPGLGIELNEQVCGQNLAPGESLF